MHRVYYIQYVSMPTWPVLTNGVCVLAAVLALIPAEGRRARLGGSRKASHAGSRRSAATATNLIASTARKKTHSHVVGLCARAPLVSWPTVVVLLLLPSSALKQVRTGDMNQLSAVHLRIVIFYIFMSWVMTL